MRVNLQQERPAVPVAVAITKHSIDEQDWVVGIASLCFDRVDVTATATALVDISVPKSSMMTVVCRS